MATRVTEEDRESMIDMRSYGASYTEIGAAVGRAPTTVARVCDNTYRVKDQAYEQSPKRKEKQREYQRSYHRADSRIAYLKEWRRSPRGREIVKKYERSVQGKLRHLMRNRLYHAVKKFQKTGSAIQDLGCSIEQFKVYIESQFQPGMSWDNWTFDGWHIDHIKPLSSFDLTDRKQLIDACHYTNLQPLWAEDNMRKGRKLRRRDEDRSRRQEI